MKKNYFLYIILPVLMLAAGVTGCTEDNIVMNEGSMPDESAFASIGSALRGEHSFSGVTTIGLTVGEGETQVLADEIFLQLARPAAKATTATVSILPGMSREFLEQIKAENEERKKWNVGEGHTPNKPMLNPTAFPAENLQIEGGGTLTVPAGKTESAVIRLQMLTQGLTVQMPPAPDSSTGGHCVYELRLAVEQGEGEEKVTHLLRYKVNVRQKGTDEWEVPNPWDPSQTIKIPLNTEFFSVFYINTERYQPLLAGIMGYMIDFDNNQQFLLGNIVNLRPATVDYDPVTRRTLFGLGTDIRYVLEHADKYVRPLQEKGQKVCICIQGGGKGIGFCNMNDAQISDFCRQVKEVVNLYGLDGVNLWDEGSGYGKMGMPEMNTTSYPKLIKSLREAMPGKLLTLVDKDEPTEYFYDAALCGDIAVGEWIDYAWHGYGGILNADNPTNVQVIEPWESDHPYSDFTRKPIAGLIPDRYGSINIPRYLGVRPTHPNATVYDEIINKTGPLRICHWRVAGRKKNNIIVFGTDLIASERGGLDGGSPNFELAWLWYMSDNGPTKWEIWPWGDGTMGGLVGDKAYYFAASIDSRFSGVEKYYSKDW